MLSYVAIYVHVCVRPPGMPQDACTGLTSRELAGRVVLAQRGGCYFSDKARFAQARVRRMRSRVGRNIWGHAHSN